MTIKIFNMYLIFLNIISLIICNERLHSQAKSFLKKTFKLQEIIRVLYWMINDRLGVIHFENVSFTLLIIFNIISQSFH